MRTAAAPCSADSRGSGPSALAPPMEGQDTLKEFADRLRAKDGVEARTAVLQGHRVEFVRGKDLVRWLAAHPDEAARFSSELGGG